MPTGSKILVVEDDAKIAEALREMASRYMSLNLEKLTLEIVEVRLASISRT